MKIKIICDDPRLFPTQAYRGDAGWDLYAAEDCYLVRDKVKLVPAGIRIELEVGYEAQVRSRSGLAIEGVAVANSPGTIDADYRGPIGVLLKSQDARFIPKYSKIAQLVIGKVLPVDWERVSELSGSQRGEKGFGSSG